MNKNSKQNKVVITGSSGRIGRAIHWKLSQKYLAIGMDLSPASSTSIIGDICNYDSLLRLFENTSTVFHTAALHAPHVNHFPEKKFYEINVKATEKICKAAIECGVSQIIFTSTTALYGFANQNPDKAVWINEKTTPLPRTIYHKTKLEAENILREYSNNNLKVRVIRMSRCFPEPAPTMAVYRLHRGIDYRDVADIHILSSEVNLDISYDTFIASGKTPFSPMDLHDLKFNPEAIIRKVSPELVLEFEKRNWNLPKSIDRVYDTSYAESKLGWKCKRGYIDVLKELDNESYEVLPNYKSSN